MNLCSCGLSSFGCAGSRCNLKDVVDVLVVEMQVEDEGFVDVLVVDY